MTAHCSCVRHKPMRAPAPSRTETRTGDEPGPPPPSRGPRWIPAPPAKPGAADPAAATPCAAARALQPSPTLTPSRIARAERKQTAQVACSAALVEPDGMATKPSRLRKRGVGTRFRRPLGAARHEAAGHHQVEGHIADGYASARRAFPRTAGVRRVEGFESGSRDACRCFPRRSAAPGRGFHPAQALPECVTLLPWARKTGSSAGTFTRPPRSAPTARAMRPSPRRPGRSRCRRRPWRHSHAPLAAGAAHPRAGPTPSPAAPGRGRRSRGR